MKKRIFEISEKLLAALLGMYFLFAGLFKAMNPEHFVEIIEAILPVNSPSLLFLLAWFLIAWEMIIGSALLFRYQLKRYLFMACVTLSVFCIVLFFVMMGDRLADCGCYGQLIKRTPKVALIEDIVTLALAAVLWLRISNEDNFAIISSKKKYLFYSAVLGGIVIPIVGLFYPIELSAPLIQVGLDLKEIKSTALNDEGKTKLLLFIRANCEHCQRGVSRFNELDKSVGIPVIGLLPESSTRIKEFSESYGAQFEISPMDSTQFEQEIARTPLVALAVDGKIAHLWEAEYIPRSEEIIHELQNVFAVREP